MPSIESDQSRELYALRDGFPNDYPYLVDTWIKEALKSKPESAIPNWHREKQEIRDLLTRNSTRVRVACAPDDEDTILGWAVTSDVEVPIVHFCYVRDKLRNLGIAKALLAVYLSKKCTYSSRPNTKVKIPTTWEHRGRISL